MWLNESLYQRARLGYFREGDLVIQSLPQSCDMIRFYSFYCTSFWTYLIKWIKPNAEVTSEKGICGCYRTRTRTNKYSLNPIKSALCRWVLNRTVSVLSIWFLQGTADTVKLYGQIYNLSCQGTLQVTSTRWRNCGGSVISVPCSNHS